MDGLPIQHNSQLFTVRIWQEDLGRGAHEWRGTVSTFSARKNVHFVAMN